MMNINYNTIDPGTIHSGNTQHKVAIFGDSWATSQKLTETVKNKLISSGFDIDVVNYYYPGAKSQQIYRHLISDRLLTDNNVNFIVVVAGVNDTICHVGKSVYVSHMLKIISAINTSKKHPLIVEIPEFGIEEKESFLQAIKHGLFRYFFDHGKVDVISAYRNALLLALSNTQLKYSLIPFGSISSDYSVNKDIYCNAYHLNAKGDVLFGKAIGSSIVSLLMQRSK